MHRTLGSLFSLIAILLLCFGTTGCGGGGSSDTPPPPSRIRLTINWAERTRNITAPGSALSAAIKLPGARVAGGDLTFTINRNGNIAQHPQVYESPEDGFTGNRKVEVTFFAQPDGVGSIVATASATVRIGTDGKVQDTISNVQKKITSVSVAAGQSLSIGEEKFLSLTARDAQNNIIAITRGSVRFAIASGSTLLSISDIVAKGLQAGEAQVTATVDGITSPQTAVTVLPPVAIAYVANGQNANVITFLQVLQGRNITPTRFDSIPDPSTLQNFDILLLGESGNIGTADAAKVKAFLDAGRGVVLLGRSPAKLATGSSNLDANLSSIAAWFGNVREMQRGEYNAFTRSIPGSFPLPANLSPGQLLYEPVSGDFMAAIRPDDIQNPLVDQVARVNTQVNGEFVYAFAYELPQSGGSTSGRVYWQWDDIGKNSAHTDKVLSLFLAGAYWTARR